MIEQRERLIRVADWIQKNINAPYVHTEISTLGGLSRASIMIKISLDKKSTWANHIFHNSRYIMFDLSADGLELFNKHYQLGKFRKAKPKNTKDAVARINAYIAKNNNVKNPIVEAAIYGLGLGAGLAVSNITINKIAGKKNPLSSEVKTFKQWMNTFTEETMPYGVLAEDGYAFYLSQQLGRSPTIIEMKKIGKIRRLLFEGLPISNIYNK